MAIQTGDKVPDLLGLDQDGKEVKVSDYKGRKIALYFYPKDNTSGCTAEACSLRDGYDELKKAGYEIIGVSKDSAQSHRGFIEKQNLPADCRYGYDLATAVRRLGRKEDVWTHLYGNLALYVSDR